MVEGVVQAYKSSLNAVQLWGPTNFAPIIQQVAGFAAKSQADASKQGKEYFVLLILTDGAISDTGATINAIVAAAKLPMSIIIIGVGGADFSTMEMLDGDDGHLKDSRHNTAQRDIVQFVPFRKYEFPLSWYWPGSHGSLPLCADSTVTRSVWLGMFLPNSRTKLSTT